MASGDNEIVTHLLKRATEDQPAVDNRFDLATSYVLTGRLNTAKTYHQSVAQDGEGARMDRQARAAR